MTPYEVLGVGRHATDDEIKYAYRKLVKQFHPDINKGEGANSRLALINSAYEILSDPERRAQYDTPSSASTGEYDEDPIEAHKREFQRKRWEKAQRARERRVSREKKIYRVVRVFTFPVLVFAIVLILDNFLSPDVYQEVPIAGWQERTPRSKYGRGALLSYLQTPSFYIRVPHHLHLNYPYHDDRKPPVMITVTPIFRIPRTVIYIFDRMQYTYAIGGNIHSISVPLPWLLTIACLFVVSRREYSMLNYALCFLPLLLLAIILVIML